MKCLKQVNFFITQIIKARELSHCKMMDGIKLKSKQTNTNQGQLVHCEMFSTYWSPTDTGFSRQTLDF